MRRPSDSLTSSDAETPSTSGWTTLRRVAPYLWPDNEPWVKQRVVIAMVMLFVAKIISVSTPFFYKAAVDALAGDAPPPALLAR